MVLGLLAHVLALQGDLQGAERTFELAPREPWPPHGGTSFAYAHPRTGRGEEADALASARKELGTPDDAAHSRGGFESVDPYLLLAFGDPYTFDTLVREPGRGPESTRFGVLSMALWADLVAHEEVGQA